jgi:hypothetical protein
MGSRAGALLLAGCSFDATGLGGGLLDGTGTDTATQTDGAPHGSSHEPSTTTHTTHSHDGESSAGGDDEPPEDTETGSGADAGASGDSGDSGDDGDSRDPSDTTGDDASGSDTEGDPGFCGDGIVTGHEACEPTDLGDATCSDLGSAYIGEPTCTESCTIDYAPCCEQPGTPCTLGQNDCCGSCQLNIGLNLLQCT